MRKNFYLKGYSLIELLIVIAIILFLSAISIPSLMKFLAKTKRSEAYVTLRSLCMAEKAYWIEHGKYSKNLQGVDGIAWKPEGKLQYTYGFSGAEGVNYVSGMLGAPGSALAKAQVSDKGFVAVAAADIDGDGKLDIIGIDEHGNITLIQDDLQD